MAACESLQQIFETALPDKGVLVEPLSPWTPGKATVEKPLSFTEIFGELHFQADPDRPSFVFPPRVETAPPFSLMEATAVLAGSGIKEREDLLEQSGSQSGSQSVNSSVPSTPKSGYTTVSHGKSDSFSSMNSESLQLCTEGLGFESCDELEDPRIATDESCREERRRRYGSYSSSSSTSSSPGRLCREFRRSRSLDASYPPPIPSISMSGKPWVCFKSYRHDGRFVLKEIRIPTKELLQASREDGRLRLHFIHPKEEVLEEENEDEEEEEADKEEQ
ncbi:hypothetical protein SAY86_008963 [Trapa natans]|uniref:FAF domain-containing protein n=1 Tax=Trapa natans TaxID=22666 RepID=A0AAN7KI30_TRANT|nr:hypothetical protein SAY86_008963 [Trapa natans]